MSAKSKIEWTDATWNPVTGCAKISTGCKNCYAERIANRFWDHPFSEVRCHPERLKEPEKWKSSKRVFVCSMSDLFHKDVPDEFIEQVFYKMALNARQHTYMILTKRPARMMEFMNGHHECVQSHVWLGVSTENQEMADERIPLLLQTSAIVRFVSIEPMLERLDISYGLNGCPEQYKNGEWYQTYPPIDWVICGAESGPGARPFKIGWARDIKNQCVKAGVPFFFKQARIDGKLVKMPELDGKIWAEYPEAE